MSEIIDLADYMDNYTIKIKGENPNPYGHILEQHCKAAREGNIKEARRLNEELKKYGMSGYTEAMLEQFARKKQNDGQK